MFIDFFKWCKNKILLPGCGIFTAFVFFAALVSSFGESGIPAVTVTKILVILLFSMVLSALNLIFGAKKLHFFARLGIHFVSSLAAFILIMLLLSGDYAKSGMAHTLFMIGLYVVLYLLILGGWWITRAVRNGNND